jgi:hypothetical protein
MTDNSRKQEERKNASVEQQKRTVLANREEIKPKKTGAASANEKSFNIVLDNIPYLIKVSLFKFNEETRYNISINGGDNHIFTWDSELYELRAIDDDASVLPAELEEQISRKLQLVKR